MANFGEKLLAICICGLFAFVGGLLFNVPNGFKIGSRSFKPWFKDVTVPPLLGMLLFGILARNLPGDLLDDLDSDWSSTLRRIALTSILYRAGLGLDLASLKRQSKIVLRMTALPQFFEATAAALFGIWLLDLPVALAFAMGFMLGAVTPAVVVPGCVVLQKYSLGVAKGIPTLLLACSSLDDVLAITIFGIFLSLSFSNAGDGGLFGDSIWAAIGLSVVDVLGGLLLGIILGYLFKKLPQDRPQLAFAFTLIISLLSVIGLSFAGFSGAGYLSVITFTSLCGRAWNERTSSFCEAKMSLIWDVFIYLLFGLIGAEIDLGTMDSDTIVYGILIVLVAGGVLRVAVAYAFAYGGNFTTKERLFVAMSWIPKATVQAAVGGEALDLARSSDVDEDYEDYGLKILTVSVLSILITSPVGAIFMATLGPKWLKPDQAQPQSIEIGEDQEEQNREEATRM